MCPSDRTNSQTAAAEMAVHRDGDLNTCPRPDGGSAADCAPKKQARRGHSYERFLKPMTYGLAGSITACVVTLFSVCLPFVLAPHAAGETYHWAFYSYESGISHFDNTIWTYGTDYGLAVIMTSLARWIWTTDGLAVSRKHRARSALLLLFYALSVLAGGIAHHFYTTLESRNTMGFRVLWTICVGSVSAASGLMGTIGSEMARQFENTNDTITNTATTKLFRVPVISEWFWVCFGVITTLVCVWGGMSFQRPACDIFVAGTTQLPPTLYLMAIIAVSMHGNIFVRDRLRAVGLVGFILNAPLLPIYPLLVQYTDWSLASVNTLLHFVLMVAWSMQGFALQHYSLAIAHAHRYPAQAVPMLKKFA